MRKYLYLTEVLRLLSTQSTHKCLNTDAFIVVLFLVLPQGKAMKGIFLVGANELFGCLGLLLLMSLFLAAETAAQACVRRCLDVGNKEPGRDRDSLDTFSADKNFSECVSSRLCQLCAQWASGAVPQQSPQSTALPTLHPLFMLWLLLSFPFPPPPCACLKVWFWLTDYSCFLLLSAVSHLTSQRNDGTRWDILEIKCRAWCWQVLAESGAAFSMLDKGCLFLHRKNCRYLTSTMC